MSDGEREYRAGTRAADRGIARRHFERACPLLLDDARSAADDAAEIAFRSMLVRCWIETGRDEEADREIDWVARTFRTIPVSDAPGDGAVLHLFGSARALLDSEHAEDPAARMEFLDLAVVENMLAESRMRQGPGLRFALIRLVRLHRQAAAAALALYDLGWRDMRRRAARALESAALLCIGRPDDAEFRREKDAIDEVRRRLAQ